MVYAFDLNVVNKHGSMIFQDINTDKIPKDVFATKNTDSATVLF